MSGMVLKGLNGCKKDENIGIYTILKFECCKNWSKVNNYYCKVCHLWHILSAKKYKHLLYTLDLDF